MGHPEAQAQLGQRYNDGDGVEKSEKKAADWYQKAADQGNSRAQSNLGLCYYQGMLINLI